MMETKQWKKKIFARQNVITWAIVIVGGAGLSKAIAHGYAIIGADKNVWGGLFGAVFMVIMLSGMTMTNVPYYMQDIYKGLFLTGALSLSSHLAKRRITV